MLNNMLCLGVKTCIRHVELTFAEFIEAFQHTIHSLNHTRVVTSTAGRSLITNKSLSKRCLGIRKKKFTPKKLVH